MSSIRLLKIGKMASMFWQDNDLYRDVGSILGWKIFVRSTICAKVLDLDPIWESALACLGCCSMIGVFIALFMKII